MSSGFQSPDQALQDYFDSLLDDAEPIAVAAVPAPAVANLSSTPNIAILPATRPAREPRVEPPIRPYAEPIRTLNLRMPLPPVAEPEVVTAPVEVPTTIAPPIEIAPPVRTVIESIPAIDTKPTIDAKPTVDTKPIAAEPVIVESAQPEDALALMTAPADWLANGRPQWAQQPFECLLFRVGGLALAAPLTELGAIYPLEQDSLTSIFGQTSWFMGLLPVKDYNVRAIDTALVVMPERYEQPMRENYRYVISLYGADWGLAVDEVMNSVRLDPDQVRWRGQRSKRPWLAGTVVNQMCALLDIGQLAWMFHNQDRKRRQPMH